MAIDLICVTCETKVSVSEVAAARHKRCHVCGDPLVPLSSRQPLSPTTTAPLAMPPERPRQSIAPAAAPAAPRAGAGTGAQPAIHFADEYQRIVANTIVPRPGIYLRSSGIPPAELHRNLACFARSVPADQVLLLVDAPHALPLGFLLTSEYCHFRVHSNDPSNQEGTFWLRDVAGAQARNIGALFVQLTYAWQELTCPADAETSQRLVSLFQQLGAINARSPPPPTSFGPVAALLAQQFPPPQMLSGIPAYFHLRQRGIDPKVFFYLVRHAPVGIAPRDVLAMYHDQHSIPHSQVILFTSRGLAICYGDGRQFPIPYGHLAGAALPAEPQAGAIEIVHKNGTRLSIRCGAETALKYQFVHMLCEIGRLKLPTDRMIEPP